MTATDVDATKIEDRVAKELAQIAELSGGSLSASAVVDWAESHVDSALHARFDWDNDEAACKWRIHQARNIIATVRVEPVAGKEFRGWVSLPSDRVTDDPVYRPIISVLDDDALRAQLVRLVLDELARLRRKHAALRELDRVWSAIDASMA